MKKSITITSRTEWSKIKDLLGNFRFIKSRLDKEKSEDTEKFLEHIESFSDNQIDFKDIEVPLSEITEGKFKDIILKDTTIKAKSDGPDNFRWVCNNLGSIKLTHNPSENNIKVTIDFKPKFGFAVNVFLKGLFMTCSLEDFESGIKGIVEEIDEFIEENQGTIP